MENLMIGALLIGALQTAGGLANPAHDQISQMSEGERRTMLAGVLRKNGERCNSADRTFHQGNDVRGSAFWNVQCSGEEAWVIQVNNDKRGSTHIRDCKTLESVKGGPCFKKFR